MLIDYWQMKFIHPTLREVIHDVEAEFGEKVFTSLYREGDGGVHGQIPLRGADLRERNELSGNVIKGHINSRWVYDPKRPRKKVCILHDTGNGLHLHFQVHPNTTRR